ncbi:MAG TPA: radical SAM protein [Polyangiaceae bacterium]|jgi:radical SAM superfamily enzyme YgiQ (UPF0313 family)|nr:radical SAM protein [Polyangiaceae bacterium]HNZ22077.1 radical SAM protein [Polyangiaceae bacterium]HOD22168.1 radical SAM protein [Polyangiaceae bacterium]HOE47385.1 radical SAM protein [Polyangiaceae bacterium]HOH02494.1 radical SAM protein [Polyangiaceae bacterium]
MAALRRCVLLVHPSRPRERTYPLGLAYLAAAAKRAGALVLGCDLRIDPPAKLVELLRQHPFDYVGITALSTTLSEAAFIVQQVRRIQPASFVVVGGPHATLAPRQTLQATRADAIVRGDGETPFAALLNGSLDVPGVTLRGQTPDDHVSVEPHLDRLPFADRSVFPLEAYYRRGVFGSSRRTNLIVTRGCPLSCGYCNANALSRGTFRLRSIEQVMQEVQRLRRDYHVDTLVLEDDNIGLDRDYALRLWRAFSEQNPRFRIDLPNGYHPALVDEELIDAMAAAGVRSIAFGIESLDENHRILLHRHFDLDRFLPIVAYAQRKNIVTTGYILIGIDGQSARQAIQSASSLRTLPFDMVHVSVLLDLPNQGQVVPSRTWKTVRAIMYVRIHLTPRRILRLMRLAAGSSRTDFDKPNRWC